MFTHAIKSTSATPPMRLMSICVTSPTTCRRSGTSSARGWEFFTTGIERSTTAITRSMSWRAAKCVVPALRRPTIARSAIPSDGGLSGTHNSGIAAN